MSTPNINCILQAVLAAHNNLLSPAPQITNYDFGNPTIGGSAFLFEPFFTVNIAPTVVTLPTPNIFGLIVQNFSTAGNLTVLYTLTGFAVQTLVLGPGTPTTAGGDAFIYWCPSRNPSAAITAVSLVAPITGAQTALVLAIG